MTERDFLFPLFSLHPIVVFFVTVLVGMGTLVIVPLKTKTFNTLVNSPSVLLGDFLFLPLATLLMAYFYQTMYSADLPLDSYFWTIVLAVTALCITLWLGRHFNLMNRWWLPHGIFHFLMTYAVLVFGVKGILYLVGNGAGLQRWVIWGSVVFLIGAHHAIGKIFPKRFPM